MNQKNDLLFFRAVKVFGVGCPGWRGALQRCSELFSNSLGTKPEGRRPKPEIPQGGTKSEARNAELLVCRFVLRISGFGLLSDLGHRLRRVLAETEFIGVSTFGFMLPQRLACLFRAALPGMAGAASWA